MSYRFGGTVRDTTGAAQTSATVTIYTDAAGTVLAGSLTDFSGEALANPTTTDARGRLLVCSNDHELYFKVSGDSIVQPLPGPWTPGGLLNGAGDWAFRNFYDAVYNIETGGAATQVPVIVYGDSVGMAKPQFLLPPLYRAYGYAGAGLGSAPTGCLGVTASAAGGAYQLDGTGGKEYDYTYWPTGAHWVVPSGGSVTFNIGAAAYTGTRFVLYYVKYDGGGGATVDLIDRSSVVQQTANITTDAVSVAGAKCEFAESPAAARSLKVTGTSGTVVVIGALLVNEAASGIVLVNNARGGLAMDDANGANSTVVDYVLQDIDPLLGFFECKDGGTRSELDTIFGASCDALAAATPNCDWMFIGTSPTSSDTGVSLGDESQGSQLMNAALRAAAEAADYWYWDGYRPFVSYETLTALGWEGDGTHIADEANHFAANRIAADTGLLDLVGAAESRDVCAATVLSKSFKLEQNAMTRGASPQLTASVDAYQNPQFVTSGYFRIKDSANSVTLVQACGAVGYPSVVIHDGVPPNTDYIPNNCFCFYIDTANAKFKVKVRDANGTLKDGELGSLT